MLVEFEDFVPPTGNDRADRVFARHVSNLSRLVVEVCIFSVEGKHTAEARRLGWDCRVGECVRVEFEFQSVLVIVRTRERRRLVAIPQRHFVCPVPVR